VRLIRAFSVVLSAFFPLLLSGALPVKMPVAFERNDGQFEPGYDYVSRSLGYAFALHSGGAVMSLGGHEPLAMTIAGADPDAAPTPAGQLGTITNYYHRSERSKWHAGIPSFERVRYGNIYDRVDVEYYGNGDHLEYDFIVHPGGEPSRIGLTFSGARALCIDEKGALVLETPAGEVRHGAPYVYQRNADGTRRQVAARFALAGDRIGFALDAPYDRSSDLIIDPTVIGLLEVPEGIWFASSMAVDAAGNTYLTGASLWWDLEPVNAIREKITHGASALYGDEAFAIKLAPNGSVVYATYLGGDGYDRGVKVAVDGSGNAYFTGQTGSSDFPTSATAFQRMPLTDASFFDQDVFLTKLSPTGALVYSTYFGSTADVLDLAVDSSGKAYVSGITSSPGFPGTIDERPQHRAWFSGGGFVAKFNGDASGTEFVTLLGAESGQATPHSIALDETGAVYVGGGMGGATMMTTDGVYQQHCRKETPGGQHCFDGFVAKLTPAGEVDLLTFLGGTAKDEILEIAVNDDHEVFVLGDTLAGDFPVTGNAVQSSKYPDTIYDCFYARLDPTLSTLEYSTYLGGDHWESALGLTIDSEGRAVLLVGGSEDFPILGTMGYDFNRTDTVLLRFSAANQLQFSSWVPGLAMAVNPVSDTISVTDGALVRNIDGSGSGTSFLLRPRVSPPGRSEDESDDFWDSISVTNEIGVFSGNTQVSIGGHSATVTSPGGEDHVIARIPDDLPFGVHDVTVTDAAAGTFIFDDGYEYTAGEITVSSGGVVPNNVPARLFTWITIVGSGFPRGAVVALNDGFMNDDYELPTIRVSSTMLRALVSVDVDPDVYDVHVTASGTFSAGFLAGALTVAAPAVGGFGPATGPSSGGTAVELSAPEGSATGYGVTVDGIPATSNGYASGSAHFTLPPHAPGRVDVVVTTPDGSRELPNAFFYYQAITATDIAPLNGPPAGGTTITITGSGFLPGAQVTLDGIRALDVVVESSTTITALTPPHLPGAVDIVVRNPDSGSATVPVRFTYDGPFLHNVTRMIGSSFGGGPNAPVTGGATIVVFGEGFADGARVFFGDVEATVTSITVPSQIKVTSPAHPEALVDLIVMNPDGTTGVLFDSFTFTGTGPTVSNISPSTGPASGGTAVTITGTGFDSDAEVTIGGSTLLDAVITPTSITGITPPRPDGSKEVRVTNPDDDLSATTTFVYLAPPEITTVSPAVGPASGGTVVTINGDNFSVDAEVFFGGTPAQSVLWEADSQLLVGSPEHAVGTFEITVVNGDGQSATKNQAFRFLPPPPSIDTLTPDHGAPGNQVVINGANFQFVTGVKFFNNRTATFSVNNSGRITATVPSFAETGPITITTDSGTVTSTSDFTIDETAPEITSFTPASGGPGVTVTLTGVRFTGATSVEFGGLGGTFTVNSDTQITATVPGAAKSGPIVVRAAGGVGTSEERFLVPPRFTTSPFAPKFGLPGTSVTISGVNFGGTTQVLFNGVAATPFTVNGAGTSITTTVPALATTGFITVTAEGGSATTTTKFAVSPQVDSFTPTSAATGGSVVLTGVRFTGATAVTFGGVNAASFTVDSDTQITAVTASGAKTGTVCVTTPGATGCSTAVFSFPPRFNSSPFSPASSLPGTSIAVNGVNFQGTTAVSFNSLAATTFSVNAAGTTITVTVPDGTTTGPVTVTAQGGTATSTKSFGVPPAVTSFTPTEGGTGTVVTLTGVRFTGATAVKFGTVAATSFSVVSDTEMTAVVSATAKSGTICITTPGGTGCSSGSFTVPARVTGFNPDNALPGANVTIEGVNLHGATAVSFHNGQAQPTFTVNAAGTAITTTVPAGAITGPVTVTTPLGTATSTVNFGVQPAVTGFTPAQGEAATVVTITGVRFTGATAVKFGGTSGGTSTSVTVVSDTEISAVVPATGKSGTICVTTPGGTGCSAASFSMPPRVTGFNPDNALPGASVVIEGVNFLGATAVSFHNGQSQPTFTVNTAGTTITTTVPAGAITGPVTVTTPIGTTTSTVHFGVRPAITSFTPSQGDPGNTVTITGVRLTGATAVRFGGTGGGASTSISVVNDTTVTATVPANGTSGTICITTPGGTGCSGTSFSMPPRVTGFNPDNAWPGAAVTVEGVNFQGATALTFFNGQSAPSFIINPAGTTITTTVPAGATTGPVIVTTPIGTTMSTIHFGVQPEITSFDPVTGEAGTVVTLTGVRFAGATAVKFGGTSGGASTGVTVVSDTTITAVVPASGKSGTICVTTAGGTGCSTATFTMPPRITGFSPSNALPGANVTINGANFHEASAVSFNGVAQPAFTVNAAGTSVTTTVPATATTGPVTVTTPIGTATSTTNFGVQAVVSGFTPASGDVGTLVTITGERFTGATAVKFGGTGGVAATVFSVVDAQTITAEVPAAPKSGTICVTTAASTACSSGTFSVPPRITGFSPANALPGANVTINGFNFQSASVLSFNGTAQPAFTVNGAGTSITTTVPAGATTGTVSVTTPHGTGTSATAFGVLPAVTGFTPASGDVGATVTITGQRLGDATGVKFGGTSGTAAITFSAVDAGTVTAVVPSGAKTGTICVTTVAGTACSASSFTVNARITSFSPATGLPGASVTITGVNFQGATAVAFNGVNQPTFTVNAAGTSVTTTVPAAATTGPITVTTPVGVATSATSFGVLPAVDSFTPSAGGPGTSVTVTGVRFTGATVVKFNTTTATTFTVVNDTTITATVPAAATTGKISVTTPGGTASSAASFTIGPKITSFTPTKGAPGTVVTINGSAFTGATAVAFNGVPATTFTVNTSTKITATVPAGATSGVISVTTPTGGTGFSSTLFYLPAAVTGFSPGSGTPGAAVTITGANFNDASAVAFNGTAAVFAVISPTQITATVPDGATTGPLSVTTPFGPASSAGNFTVLAAPPPVLAAIGSGPNSVAVSWSGNAAAQYDVQRATSAAGPFVTLIRVTGLAFSDAAAASNTAYLYRVIRVSDGVPSNVDHTTTVVFTDDPLPQKVVRAAHLTQLRTAVNALRALAGLAPATWTDTPGAGLRIKAVHTTELRNALAPVLTTLGRSVTYTDPALGAGTVVKAAHHQEIRAAVR
jgi:hypothetical protein